MLRYDQIPAAKLLIGMGIVGQALEQGEQPLPVIRTALVSSGFTNNEISILFEALRNERLRGLKVKIRVASSVAYWSLEGVIFTG